MNEQIKQLATKHILDNPEYKDAIIELAQMADEEVNDGESLDHELELMADSIEELLTS